jgi:hypothetical protein
MLNYNDVLVAQERHADMRREAAIEYRNREAMGSARISLMQRVIDVMANVQQRITRTKIEAEPLNETVQSKMA